VSSEVSSLAFVHCWPQNCRAITQGLLIYFDGAACLVWSVVLQILINAVRGAVLLVSDASTAFLQRLDSTGREFMTLTKLRTFQRIRLGQSEISKRTCTDFGVGCKTYSWHWHEVAKFTASHNAACACHLLGNSSILQIVAANDIEWTS
jgi:hypothetical protein